MTGERHSFWSAIDNYADIPLTIAAIGLGYFISRTAYPSYVPDVTPYWYVAILLFSLALTFLYRLARVYRERAYIPGNRSGILAYVLTNFFSFGAFALIFGLSADGDDRLFFLTLTGVAFLASSLLVTVKRQAIWGVLTFFRGRKYRLRRVLLVGDDTETAKEYIRQVNENPQYGYLILGFVGDRIRLDVGVDKLGSFENLGEILDRYKPSDVVFAIDSYNKKRLLRLVRQCEERFIRISFLPVIYGYLKNTRQVDYVGEMPLIRIHTTPIDVRVNAALKRGSDLVFGALLLLLTLPLSLPLTVLDILFVDRRPLEKQRVVGRGGTVVTIRSFRVIRDGKSEPGKFGKFLLATRLCGLPRLLDVLAGTLSLVGPSPVTAQFVNTYRPKIPLYMLRHSVRPGIFGKAALRGFDTVSTPVSSIREDILYVEHWTFFSDVLIFFAAPFARLAHRRSAPPTDIDPSFLCEEDGSEPRAEKED